jgi:hypothetical protein
VKLTWTVSNNGSAFERVTADRAYVDGGFLKFFDKPQQGEQWGNTVAVFAPGHWSHFNLVEAK